MRDQLQRLLRDAARRAVEELDPSQLERAEAVQLGPTKTPEHGDFASNAALVLAKPLGQNPRAFAERIAELLDDPDGLVDRVEVAGPGFLNFFVVRGGWHGVLARILQEGEGYGRSDAGGGARTLVEFVSANPTGPLTVAHGRNAVLGDCLARLLEARGHKVTREYYFNDSGSQMEVLAASLRARYEQALGRDAALPEDGYRGEYLEAIARDLVERVGDEWLDAEPERFKTAAKDAIFADIRQTLERLSIHFDVYYNELTLHEEGLVEATLLDLREKGLVYERDGATWLDGMALGLDRDRVLVRSSGEPTYLLPDVAYHREKFRRGFQLMIDVLGPDHIAQFPSVKGAVGSLGHEESALEVLLYQWVNLRRGGERVKMSTRKASFVTIDELLDDVPADVFRYFMVSRRGESHLDFDLDLARERSDRNPVFKVQYAHARLCSIQRLARERGIHAVDAPLEQLVLPEEVELAKQLGRFPDAVGHAADVREPQEVARYLLDLASAFHTYISDGARHRVLSDEPELSKARLALVGAIRTVLANGLALLGIGAPERM